MNLIFNAFMKNIIFSFWLLVCLFFLTSANSQSSDQYQLSAIGFYNVENLFDTINTPGVFDEEFTPQGSKSWNTKRYYEKLDNLARVISMMATDLTNDGVAILGVCEVENRTVLQDLAARPAIKDRNYRVIHFDSDNSRGIDVALLYQAGYFSPIDARLLPVSVQQGSEIRKLRETLYVSGLFLGDTIHIMVNHWPSRRGGQAATDPLRVACAKVCKELTDSLLNQNPDARIIIMGDFNDDPRSNSIRNIFKTNGKIKKIKDEEMFNPFEQFYIRGIGTLAWRDSWNLFDMLILSKAWVDRKKAGLHFHRARIFNKEFMVQKTGNFKGYPFRTYVGDTYTYGYSDHFPVYIYVTKRH